MPQINFDTSGLDTGYSGYFGPVQVESVMIYPDDPKGQDRYWLAMHREYLMCRLDCFDEWPAEISRWDYRALTEGEPFSNFEEDEALAQREGFLAGHCLKFLLSTGRHHPEHCSLNRWFFYVEKAYGNRQVEGLGRIPTSRPSLMKALGNRWQVAHLWASRLDDSGHTKGELLKVWDTFITDAFNYQTAGLATGAFRTMVSEKFDPGALWTISAQEPRNDTDLDTPPLSPDALALLSAYVSRTTVDRHSAIKKALQNH